jgi:hypothetical protein
LDVIDEEGEGSIIGSVGLAPQVLVGGIAAAVDFMQVVAEVVESAHGGQGIVVL